MLWGRSQKTTPTILACAQTLTLSRAFAICFFREAVASTEQRRAFGDSP
jgi:hypothetical protein